jgi:hypothetical protein
MKRIVFLGIPLGFAAGIYGGFAISKLWSWFVVPLGLPPITIAHAIGLSALVNLFKNLGDSTKNETADVEAKTREFWICITALYLAYSVALLVGYVAHKFM